MWERRALGWSPDGRAVATGGRGGSLLVWDACDGRLHTEVEGHEASVNAIDCSPNGALLASASNDRTLRIYRWAGAQTCLALGHCLSSVLAVRFEEGAVVRAVDSGMATGEWLHPRRDHPGHGSDALQRIRSLRGQ